MDCSPSPRQIISRNSFVISVNKFQLHSSAPVQKFELDGTSAVELIDLRNEGQIESPLGQDRVARVPPHSFPDRLAIGNPKLRVLLVLTHSLWGPMKTDVAHKEVHRRIPQTGLLP